MVCGRITVFAAADDVATVITTVITYYYYGYYIVLLFLSLSYAAETCYSWTDCRIGESQPEDTYSNTAVVLHTHSGDGGATTDAQR